MALPIPVGVKRREATGEGRSGSSQAGNKEGCHRGALELFGRSRKDRSLMRRGGVGAYWWEQEGQKPWRGGEGRCGNSPVKGWGNGRPIAIGRGRWKMNSQVGR